MTDLSSYGIEKPDAGITGHKTGITIREFTGEYKSARSALAAAQRLRDENQDVDVRIVKFEKSPGYWMWRVTRVVEE